MLLNDVDSRWSSTFAPCLPNCVLWGLPFVCHNMGVVLRSSTPRSFLNECYRRYSLSLAVHTRSSRDPVRCRVWRLLRVHEPIRPSVHYERLARKPARGDRHTDER